MLNNNFIHHKSPIQKMADIQPDPQLQLSQATPKTLLCSQRLQTTTTPKNQYLKIRYKQFQTNYNVNQQRIRYKSLSDNQFKNNPSQRKNTFTNRQYKNIFYKQHKYFYQPNVVDVQFQKSNRYKPKYIKQIISTHQYYLLMLQSMHQYYKKIQKDKKKKFEKCQKLKNFGLHIQSIRASIDNGKIAAAIERRKSFNKRINTIHRQVSMNKTSLNNQTTLTQQPKQLMRTCQSNKPNFFKKKLIIKIQNKDNYCKLIQKLTRMYNHYSIILYSYGLYISKTEQIYNNNNKIQLKIKKNQKKYLYYVGRGNNKNLIVSIFKKRWWWLETQNIQQANLVWTQLKIDQVISKQNSLLGSDHQHPLYTHNNTIKTQPQNQQQSIQIYTIFHANHDRKFHSKLPQKQQKKYLQKLKIPQTIHNHYSSNSMLGNKKALYYNITEYKQYKKQKIFSYIPLTFHIQKINSNEWVQFQTRSKQLKKILWIIKPGQNSNRGQGIFISNSIENIKSKIQKYKNHTFIIQRYIKNNFMFQKRKFDIRTYLLMVTLGGIKKFYWYSEGYLRTSSEMYTLANLDDPFIHLTNDAIQSTGTKYGKYQKGNKITYSQFQRYLDINFPNQKYNVYTLVQQMKKISKQVVQATYFKLDPYQKQCNFQLFGMDFLIDSSFKPWLLQVNTNPCLQLSSPVLQRLIPRMIQNLFRIVIDPIYQPIQKQLSKNLICYIPQNIIEKNKFQLIFDALFDRNLQWEQFSNNIHHQRIFQDSNQQFQNDGEIIKIQD